jgi:hypothetical protein
MIDFLDILVVIGMFALRIGVPVAIMAGLVYVLKRLDRRWEAEARAQQEARMRQPLVQQPAERPSRARRAPAPSAAIPFVPPPTYPVSSQPGLRMAALAQPCWDRWGCTQSAKAECAATQHPELPCWQARFDAEGKIPETCVSCEYFQRYPLM